MIIELHAIQSFAPSNLNRDENGSHKEALFGGVHRARISSQSAKRAMRVSDIFKDGVKVPIAKRSRHLIRHIVRKLEDEEVETEWAVQHVTDIISRADVNGKNKKLFSGLDSGSETTVAVYISEDEVDEIVQKLLETYQNDEDPDLKEWAKWGKDFTKRLEKRKTSAPDIALFGRMLAENPKLNIDAACQVAHAISTHAIHTEFDFYTAVDDLQSDGETGAAMMGYINFNSATYYRCARIDWEQLVSNLSGDIELAKQTVGAFMQAFACVAPSGMQNSFVNKHLPDFLLAVARPTNDGQSLANAFERPVRVNQDSGYAAPSVKKLAEYWEQVESCFRLSEPTVAVLNPRGYELDSDELAQATVVNLGEWAAAMTNALDEA